MNRLHSIVLLSLTSIVLAGEARAEDEVKYFDRTAKKEAVLKGTIKTETPSHIEIKLATATKEVPAVDVIDVTYQVPPGIAPDFRKAENRVTASQTLPNADDRKKALNTALDIYTKDLLPNVKEEKLKRHFEFKVARLLLRKAEEDDSQVDEAMAKLTKFKKDYPESWQISFVAKALAQLQIDRKDMEGAQKTISDLAATPNLSKELRQEADILLAQVLVAAKNYAEAEKKLQGLAKSVPADDPQAARVQMVLAQCLAATDKIDQAVAQLQGVLSKASDNDMKAQAYNTLGDCYLAAKKPEDALWAFLWVDVMYHQNKNEHAKALYNLYKLFKERQDEPKAKQCREKLEKDKQFAGLEYQRKIAAEK